MTLTASKSSYWISEI